MRLLPRPTPATHPQDVRDSAAEAATAAPHALLLCRAMEASEDWEAEVDAVLDTFVKETGRQRPEYDVCFQ